VLAAALPHADLWNAWFQWFGNRVEGLRPLMARVDAACEAAGRDPAAVGRTAAVLVAPGEPAGRPRHAEQGDDAAPITGSAGEMAERLASFASAGVEHLQLVLDPITIESIERAGEVLGILDA
jgi:alkanesulfonate monooxygenase SsuD/methylene tetrahydromethanopterin reductase-like flavin-dependent oxidoreductase (luciferase family)